MTHTATSTPGTQDVVIIGGGIIGLSIAVSLQQRGVRVLLLEASTVGSGASFGNAGHIATEQVFPIADASILRQLPQIMRDPMGPLRLDWRYLPKMLPWFFRLLSNIRPSRYADIHQALLALNRQCLTAWQDFAREWRLTPWIRVSGSLLLAEKTATVHELQQHGAKLNDMGIENIWLDARAVREREPALADSQLGGLFYPQTGHVTDLAAVCQTLTQALTRMGGSVQEHCAVTNAMKENSDSILLETSRGPIRTPRVVLAAGAHAKGLASQLTGVRVPLDTERGYHLMLPKETGRLSVPVSSADRRFIMTPMDGGLRLAGTVEFAGLQAPPNWARARQLLPLAQPMLRQSLNTDGVTEWMGFRPSIADSLPVIDRQGPVLLAVGHQHLGLTQAALTARLITSLYFDEPTTLDLHPYRLHRF